MFSISTQIFYWENVSGFWPLPQDFWKPTSQLRAPASHANGQWIQSIQKMISLSVYAKQMQDAWESQTYGHSACVNQHHSSQMQVNLIIWTHQSSANAQKHENVLQNSAKAQSAQHSPGTSASAAAPPISSQGNPGYKYKKPGNKH